MEEQRSRSSLGVHREDASSRAITAAMKALQDKIRRLEADNQQLATEKQAASAAAKRAEHELLEKLHALTQKNENFADALRRQDEDQQQLQAEVQRLERENSFLRETHLTEQRSISQQVNQLHGNVESLQETLKFEQEEKALMREKLAELNEATAQLTQQLEHSLACRETDKQHFEETLARYEKDRNSLAAQVSQLEASSAELKRLIAAKDNLIAYLQPSKSRPKSRQKTPSVDSDIARLEADLDRQNSKYRSLLQLSFSESTDLGALRQELDTIATDIEEKSKTLQALKKKHQQVLRNKLLS